MIAFLSATYEYFANYFSKTKGFSLHLVGIRRPSNFSKPEMKLFENIDAENTMTTIETSLSSTDSVQDLKDALKATYGIPDSNDLLILLSHHLITDNEAKLGEVGISNNSLLTLAVCDANEIKLSPDPEIIHGPVSSVNELFEMYADSDTDSDDEVIVYSDSESESEYESSATNGDAVNSMFGMYADYETENESESEEEPVIKLFDSDSDSESEEETKEPETWPQLGFDVITQESDVLVHKMPVCGHVMNRDSLIEYALNAFSESTNVCLKCPHSIDGKLCNAQWEYLQILDILKYGDVEKEEWIKYAKLELLAARNVVQNELDAQKCPNC